MRILNLKDTNELGQRAASIVRDEVQKNPQLLLCAATGNSPLPLYQKLGEEMKNSSGLFQGVRVFPLDEWVGLSSSDGSCDAFLQAYLLGPLNVSKERYFPFDPFAKNLDEECLRVRQLLQKQGPIDLCILGLGKNGHLGFNEPGAFLQPHCHIADLAPASQQHAMILNTNDTPKQGLTLGMKDVLSSKRIVLLISGNGKKEAKEQFFSKQINSQCPASFLWLHNNVDCLVVG